MAFAGGKGTVNNPYLVSTAEHLNDVRNYLTSNFRQIKDIDMTGYGNWEPIGNVTEDKIFSGYYNGSGYIIYNLQIEDSGGSGVGLFGYIVGASVINTHVRRASIEVSGASFVGVLVGYLRNSKIQDCTVDGEILSIGYVNLVGGAIGVAYGGSTIESQTLIENSWATVRIRLTNTASSNIIWSVGGFVGGLGSDNTDSFTVDEVDGVMTYEVPTPPINVIRNCYSKGRIMTNHKIFVESNYFGGFVGEGYGFLIEGCCSDVDVFGNDGIGGFIGACGNIHIKNCLSSGLVAVNIISNVNRGPYLGNFGGFSGYLASGGVIENCICLGKVGNYLRTEDIATKMPNARGFLYPKNRYIVVKDCVFVRNTTITDENATALDDIQISSIDSFTGFDFQNVWKMGDVADGGLPSLRLSRWNRFGGGDGSVENPYLISRPEELDEVRYFSDHFLQTNHIDISRYENWEPIGGMYDSIDYTFDGDRSAKKGNMDNFRGGYDGGNFEIQGITIRNEDRSGVGLFGFVTGRYIKNVHLRGASINVFGKQFYDERTTRYVGQSGQYVGVLAGSVEDVKISNCSSTGDIYGYAGEDVGGLIGFSEGEVAIEKCWSSVRVISKMGIYPSGGSLSNDSCGGFIGYASLSNNLGVIRECYSLGDVLTEYEIKDVNASFPAESRGGFVGKHFGGIIEKCYSLGTVSGQVFLGGFAGQTGYWARIENCFCRGDVLADPNCWYYYDDVADIAGFIGTCWNYAETGGIENCYTTSKTYEPWVDHAYHGAFSPYTSTSWDDTFIKCYYDTDIAIVEDAHAVGLSTNEMKIQSNFIEWDFDNIWMIDPNINDGYPFFRTGEVVQVDKYKRLRNLRILVEHKYVV